MAWRPHYVHECDCGVFLVLFFIPLLSIHLITDNCLFWGHASSKVKRVWLAVGKWDIWWNYGVCTKQGTVHGFENKAQHLFARRLIPSALQKACCFTVAFPLHPTRTHEQQSSGVWWHALTSTYHLAWRAWLDFRLIWFKSQGGKLSLADKSFLPAWFLPTVCSK